MPYISQPVVFRASAKIIDKQRNTMQLTVRDVARILSVNEATVYRWIKEAALPGYRVNNQYRFNRAELFEWATARQVKVSADLFSEADEDAERFGSLADALTAGGIVYGLPGDNKSAALNAVVQHMPLPPGIDRKFLLDILLAREALASTGIGDGIALPHVRNPIVLHVGQPQITLGFLEHPVDFGAIDGKPVYCLFTIISPNVRTHLHLLSQLSFALRDDAFKAALERRAPREELFDLLDRIDQAMNTHSPEGEAKGS